MSTPIPEPCPDCFGARAVPASAPTEAEAEPYDPCPSCVLDAGETFVVWED